MANENKLKQELRKLLDEEKKKRDSHLLKDTKENSAEDIETRAIFYCRVLDKIEDVLEKY